MSSVNARDPRRFVGVSTVDLDLVYEEMSLLDRHGARLTL